MKAAHQAIPMAKPKSRTYRDAWIYGLRVKELNRRVSEARKTYRLHLAPVARQYLQSVVRHARTTKAQLRDEAWIQWCRSVGAPLPRGDMAPGTCHV